MRSLKLRFTLALAAVTAVATTGLSAPALATTPVPAAPPATTVIAPFSTSSNWNWIESDLGGTASSQQYVQAHIGGTTTSRRSGGVVLRKSASSKIIVSFSGTRYQIRTFSAAGEKLLVDRAHVTAAPGTARVEINGNTITTRWNGVVIATDTLAGLDTFVGRGTGVTIYQDSSQSVQITSISMGSLGVAPATSAVRSAWNAPALVDPIVWVPSVAQPSLRAPYDRDVLIQWPAAPLDVPGGFEINGGRNVVSLGGTVNFSRPHFPLDTDGTVDPGSNNNRCLYITGSVSAKTPRTIHVENFHCAGDHVYEGINIDSKAERGTLTVQLRNIKIDRLNAIRPGGIDKHYGGDAFQTWSGPHKLRIDGFDARNLPYQGLFLQPLKYGSGSLGQWDFNNVYLEGAAGGSGYLAWLAGDRTSVSIAVRDFYVSPSPTKSFNKSVWEYTSDWTDLQAGRPVWR